MKLVQLFNKDGEHIININVEQGQSFCKGDIISIDNALYKIKQVTYVITSNVYDRKINIIQLQVKDVS